MVHSTSRLKPRFPRLARRAAAGVIRPLRLVVSGALSRYSEWRVGARPEEKFTGSPNGSILLTFDDYGNAKQVAEVLRVLDVAHVRAAFFLQGDWAARHSALVNRIRSRGHIVANHTYSHANLLALSDDDVRAELQRGVASNWVRPPFGRYDARVRRLAAELGFAIKYWSIDSDDWRGVTAEYMKAKILKQLHPGATILFHLHVDTTIAALPEIIAAIRAAGGTLAAPGEVIWGEKT